MNPFVSFPTQPIYGQFLIPIEIGSRITQPIMILNYNSAETQLGMSSCLAFVSNNLPLEETNSLLTHAHHLQHLNNESPQQSTTQHVSPGESQTLDETNLYPPSLHIECDKLYLGYLESSQSKPSPTDNFIEDSFKNESTKSVDDLFSLQLDFDEFFIPQLNEHTSNFDAGESQNESDGQLLFIPVSDVDSNNNSISSHNHSVSTNPTESIHGASTTCSVIKAAINQVSNNNSKPKRQRPLSMQTSDSLNKKVKPTNSNNNQITWHHVSIDSNMNQQENTFVYDNSYNMFESFTPQPSSLHNNSSSSSSTIVPPSSSNNKSSDSTCTCNNISFLHSSIIIETPESISKKMKRGRPKKDFQIE